MLGMEWLSSVNYTIWWFDFEIDLVCSNSVVTLHRQLHREQLLTASLCSAKVACKATCQGAIIWFILLYALDIAFLH